MGTRRMKRIGARLAVPVVALALLAAACAPTPAPAPAPTVKPHGAPGNGPVIANFFCPVRGAQYRDDYGPRGTGYHYGIDMMAPKGAALRAVLNGKVHFAPNEGAGGNAVYLKASDGNTYYYAHLNDFVGTDRTIARGSLLGHVGQTGNATGPHLHFEIRLGGPNGMNVDPWNTLRASGC